MVTSVQAGVELMEASGVGSSRLQEWSDLFARSADYSLEKVAVGLQYLVLLSPGARSMAFDKFGFSPVAKDVYAWMAMSGNDEYARLMRYGFVVVEDDECNSVGCEEVLSIVPRGPFTANAVSAADMPFMKSCDMRMGPECMAGLSLKKSHRVDLVEKVSADDSMQLVRCAVQDVVTGGVDMDMSSQIDELKWFVVDDILDDFAEAKGLFGLGVSHASHGVVAEHCFSVHCAADKVPLSTVDGYCYLKGFKYELYAPVHGGLGELPLLKSVLTWYALAIRHRLAIPVDITCKGNLCHFEMGKGDPIVSLQRMLDLVRHNVHVRVGVGLITQVAGTEQERCGCGVAAGPEIPQDVIDAVSCDSGTVVVAWMTAPIRSCRYTLTESGTYNVKMHGGRLAVDTSVAMVTIPKGMQLLLNGGCMLDTRDVVGSVRLMCIGGFKVLSEDPGDDKTFQVTVGDSDDFVRWYNCYVDDTPHFAGLVQERGIGVYAWSKDRVLDRKAPSMVWSKLIDDVAVALLSGGLRVGVPFNLRVSLSGYVDVIRVEFGAFRTRGLPVCYKALEVSPFPCYVGLTFVQWLHTQLGSECCLVCASAV